MRRSWPFILSQRAWQLGALLLLLSLSFSLAFTQTPGPDPGLPLPPAVAASDDQPGAVLTFPIFTSNAASLQSQNTRFNLTNIDLERQLFVHLFFVAETCSVADNFVCLTALQTMTFLASDFDPGTTGYLIAVAVDAAGCPANRNALIGDEYVKFRSGHSANLGAESFAALPGWQPCAGSETAATINFDGVRYSMAARVIAVDNLSARADGNEALFIINRLGGDLRVGASTIGNIFGLLYDDAENVLSLTRVVGTCQYRDTLLICRFPCHIRFETFIPAGRSGWLKQYSLNDAALFGAVINFNPNASTVANAYNQGHNFHRLTLTNTASITIPIMPPSC